MRNISNPILFDGLTEPMPGYTYAIIGIPLALLLGCLIWRLTGRKLKWYVPLVIVLIGTFGGGVPVWDQSRVRNLAATPGGLTITRGVIGQVWHIETRTRDMGNKSSITYKTNVDEGFDVGTQRFAWRSGSCLSQMSLCRLEIGGVKLAEGMAVEVHWFKDAAQDDNQRVVILRRLESAAISGESL